MTTISKNNQTFRSVSTLINSRGIDEKTASLAEPDSVAKVFRRTYIRRSLKGEIRMKEEEGAEVEGATEVRKKKEKREGKSRLMSLLRGSFHALSSRSSSKLTQKARDYFHDSRTPAFRENP